MKNVSKLFLISLLAGSMMLAGCGESNPTSSTATENTNASEAQQTNTNETASTYDVYGKVTPTIGQFDDKAVIKITLTNIATKVPTSANCVGQMFAFEKVNAGYYKVEAVDSSNIYETETIYKKVDTNIEDLTLTLTPRAQEVDDQIVVTLNGKIIDKFGNDIPFASVSAENTKTGQIVKTSTNPDNGNYTFKDIPAGTYKVTFSKDSFENVTENLIITDENTITFQNMVVANNTLSNVTLNYKLAQTGSIAGVLTGYTAGQKCLLYKTSNESATTIPGIVLTFVPQDNGYFFIKNLAPGWYIVAKDGCAAPQPVTDAQNNFIGYGFAQGDTYFSSWMQVINDTTTPVPSAEQ